MSCVISVDSTNDSHSTRQCSQDAGGTRSVGTYAISCRHENRSPGHITSRPSSSDSALCSKITPQWACGVTTKNAHQLAKS